MGKCDFTKTVDIAKIDEERRLVFGWFSVIEKGGEVVVDHEDQWMAEEDLENVAYDFVLDSRVADENHEIVSKARLVETIVFTKEKQHILGIDLDRVGWWGGWYVDDDDVWKAVKSGKYKSFSIGGKGAVSDEPVPEVV